MSRASQSALDPAGPAAANIAELWWILLLVCSAVLLATLLLLGLAVLRRPRGQERGEPLGTRFIAVAGVFLPALVLIALLFASLRTSATLRPPAEASLTIEVIGHQWWWEVRYPELGIITANELHIPVGASVRLELRSADVIHSFWVPSLHGKMDLLPEHTNVLWLAADRPGLYRGQCAEFCGVQHALMALVVVALAPEEFDAWVARHRAVRPPPDDSQIMRGQEVFFAAGCAKCHAIAGTPAVARIGPDLTFIGSRRTLGAGTLPNTRGYLGGWIANPQPLKPGNKMPPSFIDPLDFHDLLAYLESLE